MSTATTINPFQFTPEAKPLANGGLLVNRGLDDEDDDASGIDFDQYEKREIKAQKQRRIAY
jgi:hypothetical protein